MCIYILGLKYMKSILYNNQTSIYNKNDYVTHNNFIYRAFCF